MFKKILILVVFYLLPTSANSVQINDFSCKRIWDQIIMEQNLDPLYKSLIGLCGNNFKKELRKKISNNRYLNYRAARYHMFSSLDNVNGEVCGVYSGTCIVTSGIPDHLKFNTEHSWCQSWGAVGIALSDLHHLYPVRAGLNSKRNNYPFCEVSEVLWVRYGSIFGRSYSRTICFEPPKEHKGELARAMFYFSVRYNKSINLEQEKFFRKWSENYSVSTKEYNRNENIYLFQNNRNPFIQYPDFVKLIRDF